MKASPSSVANETRLPPPPGSTKSPLVSDRSTELVQDWIRVGPRSYFDRIRSVTR